MKKVLLSIVILLVVIVGAAGYLVYNHLDYLVKVAIEYYGTDILKTDVQVRRVRINLDDSHATIHDFEVGNPANFQSTSAFTVGKVSIDLDMDNSTIDTVIIDKILVRAPRITYEINQDLESNLAILSDNANTSAASGQSPDQTAASGSQPVFIVRHFSLEQASLHALIAPAKSRKYDLSLRDIQLHNLGGKDGMNSKQITAQITKAINKEVQSELTKQGIGAKYRQQIDAGKQKLESKIDEKADEKKSGLKNKLKDLL
jgi:hypothetical protein